MKKRVYRSVTIGQVALDRICEAVKGRKLVVGVDVAKEDFVTSLMIETNEVVETIKWKHPHETLRFVEFIKSLPAQEKNVALEPSGTYGEALKEQFWSVGIPIFEVSPKRVHDAAEVYDGVPSTHDPKCAAIIAKLHLDGASRMWRPHDEMTRKSRALIDTMELYQQQVQQLRGRLEGVLAKYWPGIGYILPLQSATLLELLIAFGGPEQIAAQRTEAGALMKRTGGHFLQFETIESVLQLAASSIGVKMLPAEEEGVKVIAREMRRAAKEAESAQNKLRELTSTSPAVQNLKPIFGHLTAAVLVCLVGDPSTFASTSAFLKACGLNLKEHSSGKHKGKLKITKRGSGTARQYLFLAALRAINQYPHIKDWYERKTKRDGGVKLKGIVAIMRKLGRAACHVARGEKFDETKLFDVRLLTPTKSRASIEA